MANIWNYIDNELERIAKAEKERNAYYAKGATINNPTYTIRQQLSRGIGTACNPNTSMIGGYR